VPLACGISKTLHNCQLAGGGPIRLSDLSAPTLGPPERRRNLIFASNGPKPEIGLQPPGLNPSSWGPRVAPDRRAHPAHVERSRTPSCEDPACVELERWTNANHDIRTAPESGGKPDANGRLRDGRPTLDFHVIARLIQRHVRRRRYLILLSSRCAYSSTRSHSEDGKCFASSCSPMRIPRESDSGWYSGSTLCISCRRL
jgi:hypothetical protein